MKTLFYSKKNYHLLYIFVVTLFFTGTFSFGSVFASDTKKKDSNIRITADNLNIKNKENFAEFSGNVEAVENDFSINSNKLKIYYKGDAKNSAEKAGGESIDKIIAHGDVLIKMNGKTAFAKSAQYTTNNQILILTGENVKVISEKNSITGTKIVLDRISGNIKVEGESTNRVKAIFYSKNKVKSDRLKPLNSENDAVKSTNNTKNLVSFSDNNAISYQEDNSSSEMDSEHLAVATEEAYQAKEIETPIAVPVIIKPADVINVTNSHEEIIPLPDRGEVKIAKLKQNIILTNFENRTSFIIHDMDKIFYNNLIKIFNKKCSNHIFQKPEDKNYPLALKELPRNEDGKINYSLLSDIGRKNGLNGVITGILKSIYTEETRHGFGWFKKTKTTINICIEIILHDINAGSKIIDRNFVYKLDVDKALAETIMSDKIIDPKLLDKDFVKDVLKIGKKMAIALNSQSWMGVMTSSEKNNIIIFAGGDIGLVPGNILKVYSMKTIEGFKFRSFFMPGDRAGEIKLVHVNPGTSKAVIISGFIENKDYFVKPD